ncbi:hypothetical protein BT96DRAFT_925077 [Gymnopus androsaceus JB14]|uniref:Uncharacterized protein n=1 Tax=Gymnopus androsaceus JB14 TaxID=1447944 RepID=A0A6A4H1W6_9AGAR|nr:hypothetical protein BT96DRAFT_925077 [Gymnopus androsaceus JB14]
MSKFGDLLAGSDRAWRIRFARPRESSSLHHSPFTYENIGGRIHRCQVFDYFLEERFTPQFDLRVEGIENRIRFDEFKKMLVDSQCVLENLHFLWYKNHLKESIESLVNSIRLIAETHTHYVSEHQHTR